MPTKKSAASTVAAEPKEEVAVVEEVEEVVVQAEVAPSTLPFTARNTWTAYYSNKSYNFVEGKTYQLPAEVANWFNSTH